MQVILLNDLEQLGYKHDVVTVKNGYGRNYLIPKGLAVIANAANNKKLEAIIAKEEATETAKLEDYKSLAKKLEGKTVKVGVKAGTTGKIFGSVTEVQVVNALKEQFEVEIARKKVQLPESIKEVGTYPVVLVLHPDVQANIEIELISE